MRDNAALIGTTGPKGLFGMPQYTTICGSIPSKSAVKKNNRLMKRDKTFSDRIRFRTEKPSNTWWMPTMSDCPTCGATFDTERGVKLHHTRTHGVSLTEEQRVCEGCGDSFTIQKSRLRNEVGNFCSPECAYSEGREEVPCSFCGTVVEKPTFRTERYTNEYCSRDCYFDHMREDQTRAPGWVDGRFFDPDYKRKYNGKFREIREEIYKRDGGVCQGCGLSNEDHINEYGCRLHVHHIQPAATALNHDIAHEKHNLVSLCLPCHRDWEGIPVRPSLMEVAE